MNNLTAEILRSCIYYDPKTGIFINRRLNRIVGNPNKDTGYVHISVNGKSYTASRLAWLYMTGKWPNLDIDHKDLNKANNTWNNLREATESQNGANARRRIDNTSGFKGISFHRGKWLARLKKNGKNVLQSRYPTPQEAHEAYVQASLYHYGKFARHS